jgi:oligopeptide/dipeptide ABC transporter ATP-binding protein
MPDRSPLLEISGLKTHFFLEQGIVRAVDGVNLTVYRGQTVGVVGESGCGKSVMARSILRIEPPPGHIVEGEILFHQSFASPGSTNGSEMSKTVDLVKLDARGKQIRQIRGAEISMVFQEPMTSLSPVHTIGSQIEEAILLHQDVSEGEARNHAIKMLESVGMPRPHDIIDRYPHQLSGGMRQRAMIAMSLSCHPTLLIADEPTTALDVTTQAQILTLMRNLQQELGMAILFITHDLGVIAQMTEYVVVMYLGEVVESATVGEIFSQPKHPYTQALLNSIPQLGRKSLEGRHDRLMAIQGSVPDPYQIPKGCPFHPRCPYNDADRCIREKPVLREISQGHFAQCHYAEELALEGSVNLEQLPV